MQTTEKPVCLKCEGKGRIKEFSHIDNGICYACGGTGRAHIRNHGVETYEMIGPQLIHPDAIHEGRYTVYFEAMFNGEFETGYCAICDTFEEANQIKKRLQQKSPAKYVVKKMVRFQWRTREEVAAMA